MRHASRLALAPWVALAATAIPLVSAGAATRAATFTCVVQNANTCVVTIDLTPNMNEQVGSTMPDQHPWFENIVAGSQNTGGYSISGPGAPQTYWNGVSGATQGTVWSALLQTPSNEATSGAYATITFAHVQNVAPPKPYSMISASYPLNAVTGSTVTVTAVVHPVPPPGHVILQRLQGTVWKNFVGATYSAATKKWTARFRWPYPKHTSKRFRVAATAAPGLLATAGGPFTISTLG